MPQALWDAPILIASTEYFHVTGYLRMLQQLDCRIGFHDLSNIDFSEANLVLLVTNPCVVAQYMLFYI
jgi:hypothetical protein